MHNYIIFCISSYAEMKLVSDLEELMQITRSNIGRVVKIFDDIFKHLFAKGGIKFHTPANRKNKNSSVCIYR